MGEEFYRDAETKESAGEMEGAVQDIVIIDVIRYTLIRLYCTNLICSVRTFAICRTQYIGTSRGHLHSGCPLKGAYQAIKTWSLNPVQ